MAEVAGTSTAGQVQARFVTKLQKYAIPDTLYSIPTKIDVDGLSSLINGILKEDHDVWKDVAYDFLIAGEFLRVSLGDQLEEKGISTEAVIEIEYVEKLPAPEPHKSLLHDDWVSAIHADKSPKWILTGCYDNTLHVWDMTGNHKVTIPGHGGPIKAVSWLETSDHTHTFVSASHDQTVMLWRWDSRSNEIECISIGRGHSRSVECVAPNPSKQMFASGSWDTYIKMWSAELEDQGSQDDGTVQEGNAKKVKTLGSKVQTRVPLVTMSGHTEAVSAVVWPSDEEILTASWDHTIRFWDPELGGMKSQIVGNKAFFDADWKIDLNLVITAAADRHVRLYDPRSKEGSLVKATFTAHDGWVTCVKWSPKPSQPLFISGGHDKTLRLWDIRSVKAPLYDMSGHEDKILCCDWSAGGFLLSGSTDCSLKIFKDSPSG